MIRLTKYINIIFTHIIQDVSNHRNISCSNKIIFMFNYNIYKR